MKLSDSKLVLACCALLLGALVAPVAGSVEVIPCKAGNKWDYDCVKVLNARITFQGRTMATAKDASYGSATYEVASSDDTGGEVLYDYHESRKLKSVSGDTESMKLLLKISNDESGLQIHYSSEDKPHGRETDEQTYDPPLSYYNESDAAAGRAWDVGIIRDGDTACPMTGRGAGRETVTVPAGTFENCLKVVYSSDEITGTMEMWDKTFSITSGRTRGVYWIAENVGVVKEL